jgi:hypothetical protein
MHRIEAKSLLIVQQSSELGTVKTFSCFFFLLLFSPRKNTTKQLTAPSVPIDGEAKTIFKLSLKQLKSNSKA